MQKIKEQLEKTKKRERKQEKEITAMRQQERWTKIIGAVIVVLLLLLLLAGYMTDWLAGISKDSTLKDLTPTSAAGNASTSANEANSTNGDSTGTTSNTSADNGTKTNSSTNSSTSNTTRESSSASTTTNNNTTTTTNNTATTQQPSGIVTLYSDTSVGETLDSAKSAASSLGIVPVCHVEALVVDVCVFTQNGSSVTTKSVVGTGLITSVIKNF